MEKLTILLKLKIFILMIALKILIFFLAPLTHDRRDFEIKISGGDLIAYKSPSLAITNISKKQLKDALNNILEDLNANDRDFKGDDLNSKKK